MVSLGRVHGQALDRTNCMYYCALGEYQQKSWLAFQAVLHTMLERLDDWHLCRSNEDHMPLCLARIATKATLQCYDSVAVSTSSKVSNSRLLPRCIYVPCQQMFMTVASKLMHFGSNSERSRHWYEASPTLIVPSELQEMKCLRAM